jgi:hypothetical protein
VKNRWRYDRRYACRSAHRAISARMSPFERLLHVIAELRLDVNGRKQARRYRTSVAQSRPERPYARRGPTDAARQSERSDER